MLLLRSVVFALFQAVTVIPVALGSLVCALFPHRIRYRWTMTWPKMVTWGGRVICGMRYEIRGAENLPDRPIILLSKHQSAWETLFYPGIMPREVCYVYKRELHWVPFFGWGIALLNMVHIDRGRSVDALESVVRQGGERLAEGRWIIMFPEGTRIAVGKRGRYKAGGARLAVRLAVPVVPIAHNAGELWPRNSFIKKPGLITVSIGPAIASEGLTAEELLSKVEFWIETEMRRISPKAYADANP